MTNFIFEMRFSDVLYFSRILVLQICFSLILFAAYIFNLPDGALAVLLQEQKDPKTKATFVELHLLHLNYYYFFEK